MQVRVQFFSHLRDLAGSSETCLELPDGSTIADLLHKLYEAKPALQATDKTILTAAGVEFVGREYQLKNGDEISVMPPLQGG
jgi:molybdopterin converting factor small subunit